MITNIIKAQDARKNVDEFKSRSNIDDIIDKKLSHYYDSIMLYSRAGKSNTSFFLNQDGFSQESITYIIDKICENLRNNLYHVETTAQVFEDCLYYTITVSW